MLLGETEAPPPSASCGLGSSLSGCPRGVQGAWHGHRLRVPLTPTAAAAGRAPQIENLFLRGSWSGPPAG